MFSDFLSNINLREVESWLILLIFLSFLLFRGGGSDADGLQDEGDGADGH